EYGGRAAEDADFAAQFSGKTLPLALGEDVDALSGATVTSAAVVEALNGARKTAAPAQPRTVIFSVTGILVTGGEEEGYVFLSLEDMASLTGEDKLDVAELSVSAAAEQLEAYASAISENSEFVQARLVKRVTRSEAAVLTKLQALVFLVTAVVLLLTMICVATTMTAVVTERRREIGLRKALGASDQGIMAEFMGEGLLLGAGGGLLGTFLGFAFAQYVSIHVFSASITFMAWLLPVTILSSVLVTGLACLPPVRATTNVDPALVLKGE
ncbi:MAG: FtsX-like permease family protein, partial [Lachnospiraceae bacterium]|nr:FtsX-like permease family protein [Lachnospiraceae bacterium]